MKETYNIQQKYGKYVEKVQKLFIISKTPDIGPAKFPLYVGSLMILDIDSSVYSSSSYARIHFTAAATKLANTNTS